MNRKIDSTNQPEDTEGHATPRAKRPRLKDDKPADTEGHKAAKTRRPATRKEDSPADTEGHRLITKKARLI